jgi:hypothetical protein
MMNAVSRKNLQTGITRLLLPLVSMLVAAPEAKAQKPLEGFPVCEPSAAVRVPCGPVGTSCLLVGDNEESKDLYLYRIQQASLKPMPESDFRVPLGGAKDEVSDIEAMASSGPGEILIFGSHGRDRSCNAEGKRRRFLRARFADGKLEALGGGIVKSKKISCERLFGDSLQGGVMQAVCTAIDSAEQEAEEVAARRKETKDKDRAQVECEQASPFNLEGAVAVQQGGRNRVWAGLRSPLVEFGNGANKAVLLGMADSGQFEFNAAALLDLGGRGVRELAESGEWIWGIAGPAQSGNAPFSLWRFRKSELKDGAVITPELVRRLPDSSEGLVPDGDKFWVLTDGGRGKERCTQIPEHFSTPLP